MKYTIFLILSFIIYEKVTAQIIRTDVPPGYKSSGIFDTVKAVILIDNKKLKLIDRIEGYAQREWKRWWGGIDPDISPDYYPLPNKWQETGCFFYQNKVIIRSKIWQYEILKDPQQPNYDSIENSKKSKDTLPLVSHVIGCVVGTIVNNSISLANLGTIKGDVFKHYDTAKVTLYIDKKPWYKHTVKLKKMQGYRISNLFYNSNSKEPQFKFYDGCFKEIKNKVVFILPNDLYRY